MSISLLLNLMVVTVQLCENCVWVSCRDPYACASVCVLARFVPPRCTLVYKERLYSYKMRHNNWRTNVWISATHLVQPYRVSYKSCHNSDTHSAGWVTKLSGLAFIIRIHIVQHSTGWVTKAVIGLAYMIRIHTTHHSAHDSFCNSPCMYAKLMTTFVTHPVQHHPRNHPCGAATLSLLFKIYLYENYISKPSILTTACLYYIVKIIVGRGHLQ